MKQILLALLTLIPTVTLGQTDKSLLWEISKEGAPPSYLFGTMHSLDKRIYDLPDSVMPSMARSQTVALELEGGMDQMLMALGFMMMDSPTVLKDLLPPKEYKRVKKFAEENMGMLGFMIDRMKPIFVAAMVEESFMPSDVLLPIDMHLGEEARKAGKNVVGLESLEEQMAALDYISLQDQAQFLIEEMNDLDGAKTTLENMLQAYKSQDLDKLMEMVLESEMPDSVADRILTQRNVVMVHRLDSLLSAGSVFCAVGAAHLPGNNGLIGLLRGRGYKVRPIFSVHTEKASVMDTEGWQKFIPESRAFSVMVPMAPELEVDSIVTEDDIIPSYRYSAADEVNQLYYFVIYVDYTNAQFREIKGNYYKNAIKGMQKNTGAEIVTEEKKMLGNIEGREVEFKIIPGMNSRTQIFLAEEKKRSYLIMLMGAPDVIHGGVGEKFFGSFMLD